MKKSTNLPHHITLLILVVFSFIQHNCKHRYFEVEAGGLIEHERVAEYNKRNYTWPPLDEEYVPNTKGWRKIMQRRFEQVQRIEDRSDMYNGKRVYLVCCREYKSASICMMH